PADPEAAAWPPPALLRASARAGPGPVRARQTRRDAWPSAGHRPAPAAAVRPAPGPAPAQACPAAAAVRHGDALVRRAPALPTVRSVAHLAGSVRPGAPAGRPAPRARDAPACPAPLALRPAWRCAGHAARPAWRCGTRAAAPSIGRAAPARALAGYPDRCAHAPRLARPGRPRRLRHAGPAAPAPDPRRAGGVRAGARASTAAARAAPGLARGRHAG